ncbi:MAG: hypothetical protein ABI678_17315 [Kofleriaceae bacterium]
MLRDLSPASSVKLELGTVIGEGGMGVIHAAEQLALGRTVAVKTLKANRTRQSAISCTRRGSPARSSIRMSCRSTTSSSITTAFR